MSCCDPHREQTGDVFVEREIDRLAFRRRKRSTITPEREWENRAYAQFLIVTNTRARAQALIVRQELERVLTVNEIWHDFGELPERAFAPTERNRQVVSNFLDCGVPTEQLAQIRMFAQARAYSTPGTGPIAAACIVLERLRYSRRFRHSPRGGMGHEQGTAKGRSREEFGARDQNHVSLT